MAAGDLITADWQLEIWRSDSDRLLFGANTSFLLLESLGGLDMPGIRATSYDLQADDGVFLPVRDLLEARSIKGTVGIQGSVGSTLPTRVDSFARAFRPTDTSNAVLSLRLPGRDLLRCVGRPRRFAYDTSRDEFSGLRVVHWEFLAPDPSFYSNVLESSTLLIPTGTSTNSVNLQNDGSYMTPPIFTILGPATNPRLTNTQYNNRQIKVDVVLTASDTLVIDVEKRTIKLNGTSNYGLLRSDSQWWEMLPGQQTITFSRTGTTGEASCQIQFRDAWLAV